ncbi:MAG: ABC transporter ATP-binding protein [Mycoplasmoidaceae bacterium]
MFRLFKMSNRKTKVLAVLALIFVALQGVFEGLQTTMLSDIIIIVTPIETTPTPEELRLFWLATSMLMMNAILALVFGILGSWIGTKASLLSAETVRHNMFYKASTLSFGDIDKVTTSSIITRITNDVQKYQIAVQLALALFIRAPIMFFYGIITSFVRFWMFGMLFLGIMLLIILGFVVVAKVVVPAFERVQYEIDNANVVVRENVLGMRVIKSFCLEEKQAERFDTYNKRLKKQNTKAWIGFACILPLINSIMNAAGASIFMIAGATVINDNLQFISSVGKIYEIFNLLMVTLASVLISCMVIINCVRAQPSCYRVLKLLKMKPSIRNSKDARKLNPKHLDIQFKNVNFKYFENARKPVLRNINLKIKQGEMVGIVGPTGSGKTSLINLISRLYDLQKENNAGSVTIGGIPVNEIELDSLQDNVGVVLQERILFSGTIKYNLLYGKQDATDKELMNAAKIACADEIINEKEGKLNAVVEQRGRNFSGGQQQRLCITRTLLKKPNILILDDSTSALDMLTEAKLQANIRQQMKGMTTIIVAQRISSVKDCDHIVVMEKGQIVGYGNHDTLRKSNRLYRSIVVSQMGREGLTK